MNYASVAGMSAALFKLDRRSLIKVVLTSLRILHNSDKRESVRV